MGVASLVLGIVTLILAFIPGVQIFGCLTGIIGIILGALGKKNAQGGTATGGLVCSIIGLILCSILYIACVVCAGALIAAA